MDWRVDWGLRVRMLVTMALLMTLYLVVALAILTYTSGAATAVYGLLALGFAGVHYWYTGRFLQRSLGANAIDPDARPGLHASLDRLAQQADVPKPTIAAVDSDLPNAFVTGRNQRSATITVTSGLLETLEGDELEAVLAHELAHIKNRDAAVMTIASFLSTMALLIIVASGLVVGSSDRGHNVPGEVVLLLPVSVLVWIVGYVFVCILTRHREYAADSGAVAITGDPSALADALATLSDAIERTPTADMRGAAELNAFVIVPLDSGFVGRLVSTHPPVETRIERLRRRERELERPTVRSERGGYRRP